MLRRMPEPPARQLAARGPYVRTVRNSEREHANPNARCPPLSRPILASAYPRLRYALLSRSTICINLLCNVGGDLFVTTLGI